MRVLNDFVLLRPLGAKVETTPGGLFIPEDQQVKPHRGEVVAKGRGEIIGGHLVPIDVEPGEIVTFSKYSDEVTIEHEGEKLIQVRACELRIVE